MHAGVGRSTCGGLSPVGGRPQVQGVGVVEGRGGGWARWQLDWATVKPVVAAAIPASASDPTSARAFSVHRSPYVGGQW